MAVTRRRQALAVKLGLLLPLAVFLALVFVGLRRGGTSPWHDKCVDFSRKSEWRELTALGENLVRVGKPDAEVLFWGLLSSNRLEDRRLAAQFAERLLSRRALNWRMETEAASLCQPPGRLDRILMYRTRIVYATLLLLALAQGSALLTRRDVLPWLSILAVLGCLALIV